MIRSAPHHARAVETLRGLAEDAPPCAIPWPCIYEFLRVVTHPRVLHPAMPLSDARRDLQRILASPTPVLLHETALHQDVLSRVLDESEACGNLIHDAHVAPLCIEHGVSELITGDRDFARGPATAAAPVIERAHSLTCVPPAPTGPSPGPTPAAPCDFRPGSVLCESTSHGLVRRGTAAGSTLPRAES